MRAQFPSAKTFKLSNPLTFLRISSPTKFIERIRVVRFLHFYNTVNAPYRPVNLLFDKVRTLMDVSFAKLLEIWPDNSFLWQDQEYKASTL